MLVIKVSPVSKTQRLLAGQRKEVEKSQQMFCNPPPHHHHQFSRQTSREGIHVRTRSALTGGHFRQKIFAVYLSEMLKYVELRQLHELILDHSCYIELVCQNR